jgi:HK97 family phage major capsid protein
MDTNVGDQLALLFADARDRLEEAAHIVGTGSTQPWGVVTELGLVTASQGVNANTNGVFGQIDVFALDNALGDRWRMNARWIAHKAWFNRIRALASGAGPTSAFWADMGGGQPALLLGYPTHAVTSMQSTISSATASSDDVLILGDFRAGYQIVDRIGMGVMHTDWVMGANRRPTMEQGWLAFWRTGARVTVPQAFRMLRV